MAMISDPSYALHAIRLSALRTTDDPVTPRIITLDPSFGLNPYITAMGLGDIDRWPEIKRALDSPPPEPEPSRGGDEWGADGSTRRHRAAPGLRYTQTIVGKGIGGAGMRVTGRRVDAGDIARRLRSGDRRSNSSSHDIRPPVPTRSSGRPEPQDDYFGASHRPRSDSAPIAATAPAGRPVEVVMPGGIMARSVSVSETSGDVDDDGLERVEDLDVDADGLKVPQYGGMGYSGSSLGVAVSAVPSEFPSSALPSDLAMTVGDQDPLAGEAVDEGSDVDEDEVVDEDEPRAAPPVAPPPLARRPTLSHRVSQVGQMPQNRVSVIHEEERRSSTDTDSEEKLEFTKVTVPRVTAPPPQNGSALTAALNAHVPHLVSTAVGVMPSDGGVTPVTSNPFASLYASVAAPPTVPSLNLELFFPDNPPLLVTVRKDATVEEVTGHGLWKYVEEGREPKLPEENNTTIDWGLRIVEDDGEIDEDFPPLDRESQIAKFSYGQFGIVPATDSQKKQNAAMAPLIQRRPSRVIVDVLRNAPVAKPPPNLLPTLSASPDDDFAPKTPVTGSAGGRQTFLRVKVNASADMHFTTTISVPNDTYIADLTAALVQRKHLQGAPSDWILCLADLSLALPLDRTVASLEDKTDLTLVRKQWATEHGLRPGDRRGGDPAASIFKRTSQPIGTAAEFGQPYKKWTVQRKTPIGRRERVLVIDGDKIHILLPTENRALFDSMKSTSFHITDVMNCKLTERAATPGFKIYVWRDGSRKRYEFEAENGKQASEIITCIKELKAFHSERNSVGLMRTMSRGRQ